MNDHSIRSQSLELEGYKAIANSESTPLTVALIAHYTASHSLE